MIPKKLWLVTVKVTPFGPRSSEKVTGGCPVSRFCTDSLGAHHTALVRAHSSSGAAAEFAPFHITRVEQVEEER